MKVVAFAAPWVLLSSPFSSDPVQAWDLNEEPDYYDGMSPFSFLDDSSPYMQDDFLVQLANLGTASVTQCHIGDQLVNDLMTHGQDVAYIIESFLARFRAQCNQEETNAFHQAMDDFNTCASFDLEQFIENFPSATWGMLLECAIATDWSVVEDWTDPNEIMKLTVPDECISFEYGHNAFGDALRQILMYPDQVFGCFDALKDAVPTCTIPEWPIPMVGGFVKPVSCLLGHMPALLSVIMRVEMGIWNTCLPADGTCDSSACLEQGSLFIGGTQGAPVSDLVQRIAQETSEYGNALQLYEGYLENCVQVWDGFYADYPTEEEQHQDVPPAESDDVSSPVVVAAVSPPSDGSSPKGALVSGWWVFVAGLAMGALAVHLVTRARSQVDGSYNSVELSDLALGIKESDHPVV